MTMRMPTRRAAIAHSRATWLADARVDFAMDAFAKSLGLTWSELGAFAAAATDVETVDGHAARDRAGREGGESP